MDIKELYTRYQETRLVSTDTRRIAPGAMFFALKGENFNANKFAQEALDKGAGYVVIDEADYKIDERCLLVPDVLEALQQLAKYHRAQLSIPFIGLTGSNGKTTSKELVNAVLGKAYKTYATQGNLNNHIGVPLTLLAIDATVQIAIVEMGANHLGEIALLSDIANPTHGFITNIGRAHIGTFGGYENIIRGKSELFQHLISHNGIAFINSQNEILMNMARRFDKPVLYPAAGDYCEVTLLEANPYIRYQAENGEQINTHLIGQYNFENIAVALCVGKYFGVNAAAANAAIAAYTPDNMRSQVIEKGSNTIILDAYNANPSSMQAAIETLAQMKASHKVLILGDMYELDDESEKEHRLLGAMIKERNFNEVFLCGTQSKVMQELLPDAHHFNTRDELMAALQQMPITDATILVKASRSVGLERVVEYL